MTAPWRPRRLAASFLVGLLATVYATWMLSHLPGWVPDFDRLWVAAHAVRDHQDPYRIVAARFPFALYYPGPAIVAALPFSFSLSSRYALR